MREIQRLTGVLRESNTVKCIKCGKILYLEWHQGNLDSVDCCGYDYSLEYTGVEIVISKMTPDIFPGVILVMGGVTYLEIYCNEGCLMSDPGECGDMESSADIDIPYDKVPKGAKCEECGKILKN
jgi:hypothetical protein